MLEQPESSLEQPSSCVIGSFRGFAEDQAPLDPAELQQRCMGNLPLVSRILEQVEPATEENLSEISALLAIGDLPKLASSAHRLKGTAANVGAGPLRHAAWQMESLASQLADGQTLKECFDQLVMERNRLIEAIDTLDEPS